jgi:hypothetical protein
MTTGLLAKKMCRHPYPCRFGSPPQTTGTCRCCSSIDDGVDDDAARLVFRPGGDRADDAEPDAEGDANTAASTGSESSSGGVGVTTKRPLGHLQRPQQAHLSFANPQRLPRAVLRSEGITAAMSTAAAAAAAAAAAVPPTRTGFGGPGQEMRKKAPELPRWSLCTFCPLRRGPFRNNIASGLARLRFFVLGKLPAPPTNE